MTTNDLPWYDQAPVPDEAIRRIPCDPGSDHLTIEGGDDGTY